MAFDDALQTTLGYEGGYSDSPIDTGGPTIYGISSKNWPSDFNTVKSLVDTGHVDAAQKYTRDFYKKNFWDQIGGDNLPDDVAKVAFDTAVNNGTDTAKQMLNASGGDPNILLALRKGHDMAIAKNNPAQAGNLPGWENRINDLGSKVASSGMIQSDALPAGFQWDEAPAQAPPAPAMAAPVAPIQPPTQPQSQDTSLPAGFVWDAAPASPQPPAPAGTPPPESQQGALESELGQLQNIGTGATLGWGPRIGEDIATGLEYAGGVLTPGKGRDLAEIDAQNEAIRKKLFAPQEEFNKEHPVVGGLLQGAGALTSGSALAKLAEMALPEGAANVLSKFAETHPYLAASGAGAIPGAIYAGGATEGSPEERGKAAAVGGAFGSVLGPAASYIGRNVVSPLASKGSEALSKLVSPSAEQGAAQAAEPAMAGVSEPVMSDITNKPLSEIMKETPTGTLPLTSGVRAKDPELLRVEENARQGLLGQDAQRAISAQDQSVSQGAKNIVQYLKGNTNEPSREILASSVEDFQQAGKQVKDEAQALYKARDEALATAVANKKMVGPSLGTALSNVMEKPGNRAAFKIPGNSQAANLYEDFKTMMTQPGTDFPMENYTAWRSSVSDVAGANEGNQTGYLAGELGRAADGWLENKFTPEMLKEGDPSVAELIRSAPKAWANYKNLFDSNTFRGESGTLGKMITQYEKTPEQFVDEVFGNNLGGKGHTEQIVRRMQEGLPEDQRPQFADRIFSGLISKSYENSVKGESMSFNNLRNNLTNLYGSDVYKSVLSTPERDGIISTLIKDLNTHIQQTGRKDVVSPSGGAVLRGLQSLQKGFITGKFPGVDTAAMLAKMYSESSQTSADTALFNKAMKALVDEAKGAASTGHVFKPDPYQMGLLGGTTSGYTQKRAQQSESETGD